MDLDQGALASPFGDVELEFPVTFDLRIIYVLAEGAAIVDDLEAIYRRLGVSCLMIQGVAKPGAKYGRMGSRLRFDAREQMYAAYEAIGKLPYVKMAI
jgi:putative lipoic acid-binding regulatory protein